MRKSLFFALVLVALVSLALWLTGSAIGSSGRTTLLQSGRGLNDAEVSRLQQAAGPELAAWHANAASFVGIAEKLSTGDFAHYRARGTHELFLLHVLSRFGITPDEDQALRRAGVDLAVEGPEFADLFHWAALADVVAVGKVVGIEGRPQAIYHSEVEIAPRRLFKNCLGEATPTLTGKLLQSGPRLHDQHKHWVEAPSEPNLKEGEEVVLLLSRTPLNLINLLASAGANNDLANVEREYGSLPSLVGSVNDPEGLEILLAYKVVEDMAVIKSRGFRVEQETDVIALAELETRVESLARAQEPFCRARGS